MARTIVVNCKYQPYDRLIDKTTSFGSPYIIGCDGNRTEVINKFKATQYTRHQKRFIVPERDKTNG